MLTPTLDAKILLYVTVLKWTDEHFSRIAVGLKYEYHLLLHVGRAGE
jgi:hypothetical protein